MITIDTNVLLRYLLEDDKAQSKMARDLIAEATSVLITDVVLSETIWTLKGKKYGLDKQGVIRLLNALFEEPKFCFEDDQVIWKALGDFKRSKPVKVKGKKKSADFPVALILNKAKSISMNTEGGFKGLYTFDVAALQIQGTRSLKTN